MLVNFDSAFKPSIENKIEEIEILIRLFNEADEEKYCSSCKHVSGPDPMLPAFVIDYGKCMLNCSYFSKNSLGIKCGVCGRYERNDALINGLINELEELKKKKEDTL